MCCKSGQGACGPSCSYPGTQAWVTASSYDNFVTTINSTWVRMCPALMEDTNILRVGFVLYHEFIHMVSHVGDADIGYSRENLVKLAADDADASRLSANNYMLYAA
jgi:hypothetical protein